VARAFSKTPGEVDAYKGLYGIATQTAKNIWKSPHPLPGALAFLDKLAKVDSKKRPLFAMLLAGYLAKVDPREDILPNELLDFAIEQEMKRLLGFMHEKDSPELFQKLLEALVLSTCTGGKLGLCPLPNPQREQKHPLWNSGLGELREKKGEDFFLFYPMEPDLLGERFVLNRAGGGRPRRLNTKQLEELLQTCWRKAPLETAQFFSRCAEDFASSDPENMAALFLSAMPTVKANPRLQVFFALTLVNLIACYGNAGNLPEARKLLGEMAGLGDTSKIALERANAAFNLIVDYRKAGNLTEARKLFEEMAGLGGTPEIALVRANAAVHLMNAYSRAGNLSEAQKLFEEMAGLGGTPEIALELLDNHFLLEYSRTAV